LMIDEGGYFVTAGHAFGNYLPESSKNEAIVVYNLKSGKFYLVREILVDYKKDIAIISAPTGSPNAAINGIELRKTPVEEGEELNMFPVKIDTKEYPFTYDTSLHLRGTVIETNVTENRIQDQPILTDLIRVEGMISFPGASGSPVFDNFGRLVGITSSRYPEPGKGYVGTLVAPLKGLGTLISECEVYKIDLPSNLQKQSEFTTKN